MGANLRNSFNGTYWRINAQGYFYRSEKTEQDPEQGWKQITTKEGGVYWHLEAASISGILKKVEKRVFESDGKKFSVLQLLIVDGDENFVISLPMKRQSGSMHDYVKNLTCVLPNIDLSRAIRLYPSKKQDAEGYVKKTIYVSYEGDKDNNLIELAHKYKEDIPDITKKKDFDGNEVADTTAQDTYLGNILNDQIEKRFGGPITSASSSSQDESAGTAETSAPQPENVSAEMPVFETEDDLPF